MTTKTRTYGLQVSRGKWADSDAVFVRVLTRHPGEDYPSNPRGDGEDTIWDAPKSASGLALYGLEIVVWLSQDRKYLHGATVRYNEVRFVETRLAERLARTLKRIDKSIAKAKAIEPGDVLVAFARAIGATWHAYTTDKHPDRSTFYRDSEWHFGDIASARETFRRLVEQLRAEQLQEAV